MRIRPNSLKERDDPLSFHTQPGPLNTIKTLVLKLRRLNRRMHNKLILIDRKVGIVGGGRNYQNKYFDRGSGMIFKDVQTRLPLESSADDRILIQTPYLIYQRRSKRLLNHLRKQRLTVWTEVRLSDE